MPGLGLPRELTQRFARPGRRPEEWFLGPLQARILQALSVRGASSVREIVDAQSGPGALAYTTVMTMLDHLHRKGNVTRKGAARAHFVELAFLPEATGAVAHLCPLPIAGPLL